MQLVETDNYSPQEHGFFPNQNLPLLATHPSARLIAYQTRNYDLILRNTATGRNAILAKSTHPFKALVFSRTDFHNDR